MSLIAIRTACVLALHPSVLGNRQIQKRKSILEVPIYASFRGIILAGFVAKYATVSNCSANHSASLVVNIQRTQPKLK